MTNWISHIKCFAQPMSQLVLVLLLIWFLVPDTLPNSQALPDKISKPDTEHSQFSFDTSKQSAVKSSQKKVAYFLIRNTGVQLNKQLVSTALNSFAANSFIRNSIYVHTTIHAP